MKTITLLVCLGLCSCAGTEWNVSSPWGDITTVDGVTVVTPKPIVVPSK